MTQNKKTEKKTYPSLFSPVKVGSYHMANRLVALPVHTGFAHTNGGVSPWMESLYSRLADSGVGMVIVANAAVSFDGAVSSFNLRVDQNALIPGLSRLAMRIKQKGVIACLQLNHAGRFAKTDRPMLPSPIISEHLAFNMESLKDFMHFFPFEKRFGLTRTFLRQAANWRDAMTAEDRDRVMEDFANAACRAYLAGFDMVELHGANGYLLCQYLSAFTNKLPPGSGFGGDFQGRKTFPLEVIRRVKEKLPKDFPVGFRMILREWVPDGIDLPEALAFAKLLENEGIDYLSASVGTYNSILSQEILKKMDSTAYLESDMAKLTARVGIPTIISGRITSPSLADKLVREGTADLIGLGRPLRTDPKWVKKAKHPGKKIIKCINCNWCLKRVVLEKGFNCRLWPQLYQERTTLDHKILTRNNRTLWIISSIDEMQLFKMAQPLVPQMKKEMSFLTILFLLRSADNERNKGKNSSEFDSARLNFIQFIRQIFNNKPNNNKPNRLNPSRDPVEIPFNYNIIESDQEWEKTAIDEIRRGNHGRIALCSNPREFWRERLLYRERGKVMMLLGADYHSQKPPYQHEFDKNKVIIPVDLSDVSLLMLRFLQQNYMGKKARQFDFVHVAAKYSTHLQQRWSELKRIADLHIQIPLEIIISQGDVVSILTERIHSREYKTVIMGKRGLSGMKRWLLGSVSAGVLRQLNGQSLILID